MTRRIEQSEVDAIRELNAAGLNDAEIARELGRGRLTVVKYRSWIMHLPARSIHTPRTQARRRASQSATFNRYGRPHGNYAALTNKVRAAGIGWPEVPLMVACLLRALRSGPLETPAIAAAMSELRLERDWKPATVTIGRTRKTLSTATILGMVDRLRKGHGPGRGRGRVGRPGLYALSAKAKVEQRWPRSTTISGTGGGKDVLAAVSELLPNATT